MAEHPVADIYPLAPMQVGILYESLLDPEAYVGQWRCTLRGPLDAAAFEAAWQAVAERHTALRTGFDWEHRAEPFQFVLRRAAIPLEVRDLRPLPLAERERTAAGILAEDQARGFDFRRPPLLRLTLLRLEDERHLFAWTRHHLVVDGWSLANLLREVWEVYAARLAGRPPRLAAAPPYRAFVDWLRRQDEERTAAFWRRELAGFEPPPPLALGSPRGGAAGPRRILRRATLLPPGATEALVRFARASELTLGTLVQGAWASWLEATQGGGEVVFGLTQSGRSPELPGSEDLVGLLIATLPLRVPPRGERPLVPWLRELQHRALAMQAHVPGAAASLPQWAGLAPVDALFESILIFQNYPLEGALAALPEGLQALDVSDRTLPRLALTLGAEVMSGGLELRVFYDERRFDAPGMERLLAQVRHWLAEAVAGREQPGLLDGAQRQQLLVEWNDTAGPPPRLLAHEWLERWAARDPGRTAILTAEGEAGEEIAYGELARRVRQLARTLLARGVGPGARVGVALERSPAAVVSLLALFGIGATYVPLDPAQPAARLEMQAADAGLRLLIARRAPGAVQLPEIRVPGMAWFDPDAESARIEAASGAPLSWLAGPEDLAYVIFTSGSTGRPKGVMVAHRSLAAFMAARLEVHGRPEPDPVPRWMLLMPFHFDGSLVTLSDALVNGGVLHLPPAGTERDPARILERIAAAGITHTAFLPALYSALLERGPESLAGMRFCLVAAEPCPPELVRRHHERLPRAEMINEYGPTEGTIWCSWHRCEMADTAGGIVPVGRPVPRSRLYLLDALLRPVPLGAAGEIAIGGETVAAGYLGQPAATAARFLPDPFADAPGARLYRTGDLARFGAGGALELLGRTDDQVKIRGHRAEPGEVERVLAAHPGLREAAVVPWAEPGSPLRLVAYVAAPAGEAAPPEAELRRFLAGRLPPWLVPDLFVPLPALPRPAGGKLDRRALPRPDFGAAAAEPPVGDTEERLCRIWSEVFQPRAVSRCDDFFALGGNSLAAIQVIAGVRSAFGVALQVRQLFDSPTVAGLAAALEGLLAESPGSAAGAEAALPGSAAPARRVRLSELRKRGTEG